ncbi:MAG: glycoside hydrolase family 99-like domain-containing protein [Muribaculaceae bacterium]|nr:glycoside hydrolase family 99-like domain-containing protein [Muribaculaceae bacterium]
MRLNNILLYISVFGMLCVSTGCGQDECPPPDKDKYVYDIPQTDLDRDAVVGAYYTNITSSSTWQKSGNAIYSGTPVLGEYLSTDLKVLEKQLEYADEAKLDFFVFSFDAASADTKLIDNFKSVRASLGAKVKFIINYNTKHLKVTNDSPLQDEANMAKLKNEFTQKIVPLFADDSYYKFADGTPLMLMTPSNLSSSATSSIDYSLVLPELRDHVKDAGFTPYIIGEFTTGWAAPVNYADHQIVPFDGVTLNDWKTNVYDRYYAFFSFIDLNWANWRNTIKASGTDFIPCVFPSYDDRKNSSSSYYYQFGVDGDTKDYINFCNVAKRNLGSRDVVLVNSWNNYQKGTNLEPTEENGGKYLTVTREQFKI